MHSSGPSNFRKERFTLPDLSFGHCIGILFWDPLLQSLVEQPCYKPLTRLNIAMNLGMKVNGIGSDCFVRGTRIFHNVHLLNNFNCGMAPASSTCKSRSMMKIVSNCSVNLSHNRVSYNSRCFTCNAKNQAGNKRSNPFAFVRSRANHVGKRAKVARNQRPVEHVVPAVVVEQIHQVITMAGGCIEEGRGGHCVYCGRGTLLKPSGLSSAGGKFVSDFFTKPKQYSRGLMFSLDHGLQELGHDSPGQILQATCYMCNNMMRDSPEIERRALIDLLSGKVPFPFSNAPVAKLEDLQILRNLYDGMVQSDKKRCSEPLQNRLSFEAFSEWVLAQGAACFASGLQGVWGCQMSKVMQERLLTLSIDRVDSRLPYKLENIQIILSRLNSAKNSLPNSELKLFVECWRAKQGVA